MPAKGRMPLCDALDRLVDAIGHGLAHALHGVAHLSRVAVAAEGLPELRGENIDLAADGSRTLEIRPA